MPRSTQLEHGKTYQIIRSLEKNYGRPVGVLLDLQGPKLRIGELAGGSIELKSGEKLGLYLDKFIGSKSQISLPHPEVFTSLSPGTILLPPIA